MDKPEIHVVCEPDPENPGWMTYEVGAQAAFNRTMFGKLLVRQDSESAARIRMTPDVRHHNGPGNVHGGVLLSLADMSLFAAMLLLRGLDPGHAVTIDLQCQFLSAALGDRPVDAVAEVLRETRRMVFLRGLIVQEDERVAAYSATVKK